MKDQQVELTEEALKDYFKLCKDVIILNKTYGNTQSASNNDNYAKGITQPLNHNVTSFHNSMSHLPNYGYANSSQKKENSKQVFIVYSDVVINNNSLSETVFPELNLIYEKSKFESISDIQNVTLLNWSTISYPDEPITLSQFSALLFEGNFMFIVPDLQAIWTINISNFPTRSTEDSASEPSIRGPRDGLIEDISSNVALIRRRIRSQHLACETFTLGTRTSTKLALMYMDDIANMETINNIRNTLEAIHVDQVVTTGNLEELISSQSFALFPTMDYSGRPDFVADSLLNGRFALLLDNNPTAIIAPANFLLLLKSPEDSFFPLLSSNIGRLLRLFALLLTIFLPSFYVAITTFHPDQIPFALLATISTSRHGLPLDAGLEMIIIMSLMELFREAGIRLPSSIGQTLTVVGGLIIGDAAIRAGLVSPIIIVVTAITVVASATLVNQSISSTVVLIRFFAFLFGTFLGIYGFILSIILFCLYLSTIRSFGVPYLAPLSPLDLRGLMPTLFEVPLRWMKRRPNFLHTQKPKKDE
ncbi:MAG: spore germination protein [Candidatus Pristimantibacillus lignocellulolyticus]|uniref:Spore germination protein n=1 Tax=Candidatus Pristimantibacillus lignocellulolyticus TaxID=2994561 RepID=A0A9J6ZGC9_9BACL|nr:MAG: spore germination protein [Candidatus Pristimantibacillus lignocellulolyticus]